MPGKEKAKELATGDLGKAVETLSGVASARTARDRGHALALRKARGHRLIDRHRRALDARPRSPNHRSEREFGDTRGPDWFSTRPMSDRPGRLDPLCPGHIRQLV